MWAASRRVPWKAELEMRVPSSSATGTMPRARTSAARSITSPTAPMPRIMPWRRRSNGSAASSTLAVVVAAPAARKPEPIHSKRVSFVTSSAPMTITRSARPSRIQSSATASPCVVLAHAALSWVFGPRAPMNCANWECPIARIWKRKRRSKWPSPSSPLVWSLAMSWSSPGNALAKMMPVRSRMASGSAQPVATGLPVVVWRQVRTRGMPASRRASRPAAKASCVVMSSERTRAGSTP